MSGDKLESILEAHRKYLDGEDGGSCADALRSSATSRKCRCSSAKVLAIENIDGSEYGDVIASNYDPIFLYKVGEIVKVENFDTNRWNECAPGIHFFLTREEAVKYC